MHKSFLKDTLGEINHNTGHNIKSYDKWHVRLHAKAKHHVHTLRKRPDHHKDIVALIVASTATLIVFVGWYFISFPKIIDSYSVNQKENTVLQKSLNPLDELKDRINKNKQQTSDFYNVENVQAE